MRFIKVSKELYGRVTLRTLWDLFMVWVVLINLCLIVFDLTYLWLRPTYFKYVPVITRIWDPVLGIEPNPLTEDLIEKAGATEELLDTVGVSPALDAALVELGDLTARVLIENPFERSGQSDDLEGIKEAMARATSHPASNLSDREMLSEIAHEYWSGPPGLLSRRFEAFDATLKPKLAVNYFRGYDLNGKLVNNFWKIDLPFLILFWIEFMVRWFLAIRRKTYARWFFFPIFYWYDLLSLIPVMSLRPLRLLRVISIYMRLRTSELSRIGQDIVSRTVAYISNIITEEVSDRVAMRILEDVSEEIADGTHTRIARAVVEPRRDQIEEVLANQIRAVLTDKETLANFRGLLQLNLEYAVEASESLRAVPLPHIVVKPIVHTVGDVILDTTLETVRTTFASEEGQKALRTVAGSILEELFYGPALVELERLVKDITMQVIDHMQGVVKVKKWALPEDQQKRQPMPWEEASGLWRADGAEAIQPEDSVGAHEASAGEEDDEHRA
jgi:hypothetical protein